MTASKNLGVDVGTGQWLYRQEGMVLGPLPAQALVDKLYGGELTGQTEICAVGESQFRRVAEVPVFKIHLAKAEAKHRVDAAAAADSLSRSRRRNVLIGIVATVALLFAAGAGVAAKYLAIHNPFARTEDLFSDITMEPPKIALARGRVSDEELLEYPGDGKAARPSPGGGGPSRSASRSGSAVPAAGSGGGKQTSAADDPDGMQTAQFDKSAINSVVAAKQRSLYGCFGEEARRTPGLSEKIPIEFVIGNDGKVVKLWVDHPKFKEGPLADCLFRELQKWPFKPYEGEQATVGLSFKIGKGS